MITQHLYSYAPSSYGNIEPNSISYALVTPDIYNANQTMALHSAMIRPASMQSSQQSTGLYNHTMPTNISEYSHNKVL